MFIQSGGELWKPSTYPRVGDASLGVFKGRRSLTVQVMFLCKPVTVIILNRHVAKGLLELGYYSVGRKKRSQDPNDRKNKKNNNHVGCPIWFNDACSRLESPMDLALPESEGLNLLTLDILSGPLQGQSIATAHY